MPSTWGAEAVDQSQRKPSLLYIASSRLARPTERDPCSKQTNKKLQQNKCGWIQTKIAFYYFFNCRAL